MITPKHDAHISLIGTILIMWLMVGYVYFLTPLEPIVSDDSALAEPVEPQDVSVAPVSMKMPKPRQKRESSTVEDSILTVELAKGRFKN